MSGVTPEVNMVVVGDDALQWIVTSVNDQMVGLERERTSAEQVIQQQAGNIQATIERRHWDSMIDWGRVAFSPSGKPSDEAPSPE